MRYLFACLCYHFEWVSENEDHRSTLRSSAMFIGASANPEIRDCTVIKYPWNKTQQMPSPTGIPPHVLLQAEMEELKLAMTKMRMDIIAELGLKLDKRRVGGDEYQSSRILDQVNEIYTRLLGLFNDRGLTR